MMVRKHLRVVPDLTEKNKTKKFLNQFLKCIVWIGTESTESVGIIHKAPTDSPNVLPS